MSAQHEPNERAGAVRDLLIATVEQGGPSSRRSRPGLWIAAVVVGTGAIAAASVLVVGALTGPVSSGPVGTTEGASTSSGSRVKLYASLDELVRDSAAVISGTVVAGEPTPDLPGYTTSTLRVDAVYSPQGLGVEAGTTPISIAVGEEVRVRHPGGSDVLSAGGGALAADERYLLFLTPTGLPDASEEFYVVGAGAGAYVADGDGYRRLIADGDSLPARLTESDLAN